jgi:cyclohexanone monooxygenase
VDAEEFRMTKQLTQPDPPVSGADADSVQAVDAVIIGSGISGICAGVTLRREGISDFVILSKETEFGGTWQRNTYPSVACDVPSQLYSFGFAPNKEWSRVYSEGAEIQRYLLDIVERHELRRHARFKTEMLAASWDRERGRWLVSTNRGQFISRFLILGTGSHHATKLPEIPGIERFEGRIFHSSQWPAGYDGTGDRVAVVGTGASSIQITPGLAPTAEQVTVFQRTPAWVLPKPDWKHSPLERLIIRRVPGAQRALRATAWALGEVFLASVFFPRFAQILSLLARLNIRLNVRDRRLRRALTPDYVMGCKRALVSNAFYKALNRPNVDLIPAAAAEIRPHSVVAADGTEVPVDTIVLATGFYFTDSPDYGLIADKDGVILTDRWKGHPRAYLGTAISGCPNLFVLWGPNAGTASAFVLVEAQCRYIAGALRLMRRHRLESIEVREDIETAWKQNTDRIASKSVQNIGGCTTYYLDATGHNGTVWPGSMLNMVRTLRHFDPDSYHLAAPGRPTGC